MRIRRTPTWRVRCIWSSGPQHGTPMTPVPTGSRTNWPVRGRSDDPEGRAQAFDTILNMKNIIRTFHPESRDRVLLFAHWDTRPFADKDNTRNREAHRRRRTTALQAWACSSESHTPTRPRKQRTSRLTLCSSMRKTTEGRVAPATENGFRDWCLGSQFWAENPHRIGYRARFGILLDMVGAQDAVFHQEGPARGYAPHVVRKVWKRASDLGFGDRFDPEPTPQTIDDNLFVSELAGIPSANIVDYRIRVRPMGYGPFTTPMPAT